MRADPGYETTIIAKFEGYTGRYAWHCHILKHEDNEMMRPLEVVAASPTHNGNTLNLDEKPLTKAVGG